MSFETTSVLMNWMEMSVLLAILFRLSSTFQLTANTQRELRRAIHRLGDRRVAELGFPRASASAESPTGPNTLAHLSPTPERSA
jgi:hypothetical protein